MVPLLTFTATGASDGASRPAASDWFPFPSAYSNAIQALVIAREQFVARQRVRRVDPVVNSAPRERLRVRRSFLILAASTVNTHFARHHDDGHQCRRRRSPDEEDGGRRLKTLSPYSPPNFQE